MNSLPNTKSAIKRVKVTRSKSLSNVMRKSALKTSIRKYKEAVSKNDTSAADLLKNTTKALDKAAAKNLIHKNTAARKKSRLAKALNAAQK